MSGQVEKKNNNCLDHKLIEFETRLAELESKITTLQASIETLTESIGDLILAWRTAKGIVSLVKYIGGFAAGLGALWAILQGHMPK